MLSLTLPVASLPKANVPRGERISPSSLDNDSRQNLVILMSLIVALL